jgi:hypothetical protein
MQNNGTWGNGIWNNGLTTICLAVIVGFFLWVMPAEAMVQVAVKDVSYHPCSAEVAKGTVMSNGSGRSARCFVVEGTTVNTSGKALANGDIFGRVFDATGDTIMANRGRLGSVDEIPMGEGHFAIRIIVPEGQPEPLQLKQFKAAGFAGKVRR